MAFESNGEKEPIVRRILPVFMVCIFIFISVNKAKVIKRQSVFDRLGNESPPLKESPREPEKKTEVKMLKPLKTSVTVQLKVRTITLWVTFGINATFLHLKNGIGWLNRLPYIC